MREPQIEMHERKIGIGLGRGLKIGDRQIILIEVEMIFPDEEMVLGRIISQLN
jgi:hypothetical protein